MKNDKVIEIARIKDGGSFVFAYNGIMYLLDKAINSPSHGKLFSIRFTEDGMERTKSIDGLDYYEILDAVYTQTNLQP